MGMRINTNISSVNAQSRLRKNSENIEQSLERMASGKRINKSSDDVAGLAISEKMRGQIRGLNQARRNAQDGVSFVQVAEGALNETSNIMIRVRELATQAASDTVGEAERGYLNVEVGQLLTELDRIANTTEYSGTKLLDGSAGTLDFHVGVGGSEENIISYDAGKANATAGALDVKGMSVDSKSAARSTLENIDQALTKVGTMRANFGAIQSRLDKTISNNSTYEQNLMGAQSRIQDADIAVEASNLAKDQILQSAAVSTLAQANNNTNLALKLI